MIDAAGLGSTDGTVSARIVRAGDATFPSGVSEAAVRSLGKSEVLLFYSIDPAWLNSPARTYPVTLDPSAEVCVQSGACGSTGGYYDAQLGSGTPGTPFHSTSLRAGVDYWGTGKGLIRQLLYFPTQTLNNTIGPFGNGVEVYNATLTINQTANYGSGSMNVIPGRVTQSWTTSSATWNSMSSNAVLNSADQVYTCAGHGTGQSCSDTMNVTDIVSSWYTGNGSHQPNYGFMLVSGHEDKPEMDFSLNTDGTVARRPKLVIDYRTPAATPNGSGSLLGPTNRTISWGYIGDGTAGSQTNAYVQLSTASDFSNPSTWTTGASTATSVPDGLANGQYWWRVVVTNGAAVSVPSAGAYFTWDGSAPSWSGAFTPASGTKTDKADASTRFSWAAASDAPAGVAGYNYTVWRTGLSGIDTCGTGWAAVAGLSGTTPNTFIDAPLSQQQPGCWKVTVSAYDVRGNTSSTSESGLVLYDPSAPPAPTITSSGAGTYQLAGTSTVYYKGSLTSGTISITTSGNNDPESGIASTTFGALNPATGWSGYSSGTFSGSAISKNVTWSGSTAATTTLTIATANNAGTPSASTTVSLRKDSDPPTVGFGTPLGAGSTAYQTAATRSLTWTEADGSGGSQGSGVASRSVIRTRAQVDTNAPGTCSGLQFSTDSTFAATPSVNGGTVTVADSGLLDAYCYQWLVTLTDNVGNSHQYASGYLMRDTVVPDVPSVTASGAGTYQAAANAGVFVDGTTSGTLTLSSLGSENISGIGSSTFGKNTNGTYTFEGPDATGWTTSLGIVSGDHATTNLGWSSLAVAETLRVHTTTRAGLDSSDASLGLMPDTQAPSVSFTTPKSAGCGRADPAQRQQLSVVPGHVDRCGRRLGFAEPVRQTPEGARHPHHRGQWLACRDLRRGCLGGRFRVESRRSVVGEQYRLYGWVLLPVGTDCDRQRLRRREPQPSACRDPHLGQCAGRIQPPPMRTWKSPPHRPGNR